MKLKVLDLFCGGGGFSLGFAREEFEVTGVDFKNYAIQTYEFNKIGKGIKKDLKQEKIEGKYDIIIGGPPCRPWSILNKIKRRAEHQDYDLVDKFFEHIIQLKPKIFVFENVPPIKSEPKIYDLLKLVFLKGYNIKWDMVYYKNYGAATKRKRFFAIGVLKEIGLVEKLWKLIYKKQSKPKTLREAIYWLKDVPYKGFSEHEWFLRPLSQRKLEKCQKKLYGNTILEWDNLVGSFGNLIHCCQIHPDYWEGKEPRIISVREALCIMGFPLDYQFPENISLYNKYQMIADSVSPLFSQVLAQSIKEFLKEYE